MPTQTSLIGSNTLPVPAGTLDSDLSDLTEDGLLDYLAFWIKNTLDTKLANMTADPTVTDSVPTANRFTYNPLDGQIWVRNSTPALYVWWDGEAKDVQATLSYRHVVRTLKAFYVFNELDFPGERSYHCGLSGLVALSFFKAAERGRHPSYGHGSDAAGTPIAKSLNWVQWWCTGATDGTQWMVPGGSNAGGIGIGEGAEQRGFPFTVGTFEIVERIDQDQLVFPDDVLGDADIAIDTGDTVQDTFTILNRIAPPPDGSAIDDE